jgi:hypothetical protein
MDFQSIPLHITYNSQHFEPIQYVNGLFWSLPIDSKVTINLDGFSFISESVVQQPLV